MYDKYVLPSHFIEQKHKEIKQIFKNKKLTIPKSADREQINLLNRISRNITKSSCTWCPQITKELYEHSLGKSLERFSLIQLRQKSKRIVKVTPDMLPVGHFLQNIPKFYHPDRGWFLSPGYLQDKSQWVENSIIIGYNVKSETGIHVRFKLRKPQQKIKIHKDARLIEKGSICSTRSKSFLLDLSKKLKLKINSKMSITKLCYEIKAKLMYLELTERSKGTNIKYFYSHFESARQ